MKLYGKELKLGFGLVTIRKEAEKDGKEVFKKMKETHRTKLRKRQKF